jgi:hypothetical protein
MVWMNLLRVLALLQTPYCERAGHGIFAEPLNLLSNLAFLAVAVLAAGMMRRRQGLSRLTRTLPWSLAEVALASALYHSLNSPITFATDALSLLLFVVLAAMVVLREARLSPALVGVALLALIGLEAAALFLLPQRFLNGSLTYLLMLLLLLLLMGLIARDHRQLVREMIPIGLLFAAAIFFRTIDMAVCPWFPLGTHFLWHLAAAGAAFYVARFTVHLELAGSADSQE